MSFRSFTQDTSSIVTVSKPEEQHTLATEAQTSTYEPFEDISDRHASPPLWARATSLVLVSLALAFTIATVGLEAYMYKREKYWLDHKEPSDSDNLHILVLVLIGCAIADCAASIVTLIVCLVLTAATPRLVLVNPATHGMNCLCATICILACVSGVSIGTFAALNKSQSVPYPTPLAVPIIRTVLMLAYFAVLLAAKCVKHH